MGAQGQPLWASSSHADAATPDQSSFSPDAPPHSAHSPMAAATAPANTDFVDAPAEHNAPASEDVAPHDVSGGTPVVHTPGVATGASPGPEGTYMPYPSTDSPASMAHEPDSSLQEYQRSPELHAATADVLSSEVHSGHQLGEAPHSGGSPSVSPPALQRLAWEGAAGAGGGDAEVAEAAEAEPYHSSPTLPAPASPERSDVDGERRRPWWGRAWGTGSPASDSAAPAASPPAHGGPSQPLSGADGTIAGHPDAFAAAAAPESPTRHPAGADDDSAIAPEWPVADPQPAGDVAQEHMHTQHAYDDEAAKLQGAHMQDVRLQEHVVPSMTDIMAAGAGADDALLGVSAVPPDMPMIPSHTEATNGFAWEAGGAQAHGGARNVAAMHENGAHGAGLPDIRILARLGIQENGRYDGGMLMPMSEQDPAVVAGDVIRGMNDSATCVALHPCCCPHASRDLPYSSHLQNPCGRPQTTLQRFFHRGYEDPGPSHVVQPSYAFCVKTRVVRYSVTARRHSCGQRRGSFGTTFRSQKLYLVDFEQSAKFVSESHVVWRAGCRRRASGCPSRRPLHRPPLAARESRHPAPARRRARCSSTC